MNNAAPGASHDDSRVFFFVNLLPRFVTDFGAVARRLSALGIPSSVYAPAAAEGSTVWWKNVETIEAYAERLPPGMERGSLPMQRDRQVIASAMRTMAIAWRLGRAFPAAIFVCWTIIPILFCGLPLRFHRRTLRFSPHWHGDDLWLRSPAASSCQGAGPADVPLSILGNAIAGHRSQCRRQAIFGGLPWN